MWALVLTVRTTAFSWTEERSPGPIPGRRCSRIWRAFAEVLQQVDPDFALLQEVDTDSTRSYHVDEAALLRQALPDRASVFAQNYDSPYLFWPLTEPHESPAPVC